MSLSQNYLNLQMTINITEENEDGIKLAVMNEIATQFREGEMMPSVGELGAAR